MTNEEKIISMLENIQKDVSEIKNNGKNSNQADDDLLDAEGVKRQLAVIEGLRNLLTKEEAEKLAEIVGI